MKRIFLAALIFVLASPFLAGCKETATTETGTPTETTAAEQPSDHPTEHPK